MVSDVTFVTINDIFIEVHVSVGFRKWQIDRAYCIVNNLEISHKMTICLILLIVTYKLLDT